MDDLSFASLVIVWAPRLPHRQRGIGEVHARLESDPARLKDNRRTAVNHLRFGIAEREEIPRSFQREFSSLESSHAAPMTLDAEERLEPAANVSHRWPTI